MKYLIVDDDLFMTTLVSSILKKHKVQVVSHFNMGDALRSLAEDDYDGIIMDLHMPGLDGISAIPLARQIRPEISIGLMTSDATPGIRSRALLSGADFFLQKPADLVDLWNIIEGCRQKEL
ncbi:response regulator [bacterium]|nr:response regulator [bacterium]